MRAYVVGGQCRRAIEGNNPIYATLFEYLKQCLSLAEIRFKRFTIIIQASLHLKLFFNIYVNQIDPPVSARTYNHLWMRGNTDIFSLRRRVHDWFKVTGERENENLCIDFLTKFSTD